jgi:hypothetical protein
MDSSTTTAAVVSWNATGGVGAAAASAGIGATFATIVVMLMLQPRSPREWAVALITTVIGSLCGGAALIQHYNLQGWLFSFTGCVGVLGIAFSCGLPGWAAVRWAFNYINRNADKTLVDVAKDIKGAF